MLIGLPVVFQAGAPAPPVCFGGYRQRGRSRAVSLIKPPWSPKGKHSSQTDSCRHWMRRPRSSAKAPWNLTIAAGAGCEDRGVPLKPLRSYKETWTSAEEDAAVCRWIQTTTHLRNRQAWTGQNNKSRISVCKNAAFCQRHLLHACAAGPVGDRRADGSVQLRSGASATGVLQRRCRWVQRCCCLPVRQLHICRESAAFHRRLCSLNRRAAVPGAGCSSSRPWPDCWRSGHTPKYSPRNDKCWVL